MFSRKPRELTTEDAPDSIAPWEMLDEAQIAEQSARMQLLQPGRTVVAFAHRLDRTTLACFDKGAQGTGKAVVVFDENAGEIQETRHSSFGEWFDAVVAEREAEKQK